MNKEWLLRTADTPIKYNLNKDPALIKTLLQNSEVSYWLNRLSERARGNDIGAVHGSHDYRMENILGKCWILGLSKEIPQFAEAMKFITEFLNRHIQMMPPEKLDFGKIYHFRDYEKVLACFLPLLGFGDDSAVGVIARKRLDILYEFTRQKRYDIYVDGSKLKGVKKEWQPYVIDPVLYADGHIALPDMHDFLLFAGMYPTFTAEERRKAETIAEWLFEEGYDRIMRRYGYFYAPGGSYDTKAIIFKLHLLDFRNMTFDKGDLVLLVFNLFVLSHFKAARESNWFSQALCYLEQFKNENGRYSYPANLITEKPDSYVIFGGHMNVGESKKSKLYREILSTYWMERIFQNTKTKIRAMKSEDYACLDEFLYQAIFIPEGEQLPPQSIINQPEIFVYIKDFGTQPGDLGVVAEKNGRIVGAAWTRIIPAYGHVDNETPELAVSILPEFRGQGIGSELMNNLFELLRGNGYKRTSLSVQKNNPAVRLYRRLGYELSGERLDHAGNEDYLMVKEL